MTKKPDMADRITLAIYPEGTITDAILRRTLTRRIRAVIRAAVHDAVNAERDVTVKYLRRIADNYWAASVIVGTIRNEDVSRHLRNMARKIEDGDTNEAAEKAWKVGRA